MSSMQFSTLFALNITMRRFCILAGMLLLAGFARGQVVVEVEPSVKEMEETRTARRKANLDKVRGYRILIGFFSSRAEAEALKEQAQEPFGGKYGVTVIYDEPNFKVYVGQFTLSDDADAALVEIRRKFSSATRISDIIKRTPK